MSERMSNAPVYYALAQARFNPVAAMSKYVEQVQDRLRQEGYPLFEPQQVLRLIVPGGGQDQGEPQIRQAESWLITRNDRAAGFILGTSGITFHTTHYETHETFIPELLRGLQIVHEAVALDHVNRLGLRYLDAVLPQGGETVERYLVDGLHGIRFDTNKRYSLSESVFDTDLAPDLPKGTLVARVYNATAPLGFPPDMMPNGLILMPKFQIKEPWQHAVIDTDHYVQAHMPVDYDKISGYLSMLHAATKDVFNAIATDHARAVWS
ncbi:TIGR04255 family protein [Acidithiobacillus ferriphilus]|uniref:TIGR04255 family protein n=1 Tax=Acidithiobacillus ferriphilus TaxID=1689834 RepID=UPI001C076389|nr:TIGR04255 family protein [Acidithiobacillus ferriphilus]